MTAHDAPYTVRLAQDARDLRAAQRLRYRVFVTELGASGPMVDHINQLEQDEFDPFFDHLLLIDPAGGGCWNWGGLVCIRITGAGRRCFCCGTRWPIMC